MIEYVTAGQIDEAIESYYMEHRIVLSFYSAILYLKKLGRTTKQRPLPPDFSKWDLDDLPGLLDLFARIPIPIVTEENAIATENAHRQYYDASTAVFRQPIRMQTLDHPEHKREPSNNVRIIYVLSGSCRITLNSWSTLLEKESIVILSADMDLYLEGGKEDIILNVYIDRSLFSKSFFSDMQNDDVMIPFFEQGIYEAKNGIIYFKALHPNHIHSIFQQMLIEMCNPDSHSEYIIRSYIRTLCIELNRASKIYSASIMDNLPDSGNRLVHIFPSMLQYMKAHYETISLSSLAEHFNYDSAYLSKMFKKLTGTNFTAVLTKLRLESARQLLLESDKKAEAIALQIGYDSFDHFSRVFKKTYGMTPTEYRREYHSRHFAKDPFEGAKGVTKK